MYAEAIPSFQLNQMLSRAALSQKSETRNSRLLKIDK